MDLAAIGAASIQMSLAKTQQAVDVTMVKKAMDIQETQAAALIDSLQNAGPSFGHRIDVRI